MAEYATKGEVEHIVNTAVTKAVDDITDVIKAFAQNVDDRFNKVEKDIADLNVKYDKLVTTLDRFLKRLDDMETDNAARDAQIARIERWVEQVATKTGVKLEY